MIVLGRDLKRLKELDGDVVAALAYGRGASLACSYIMPPQL